MPKPNYQREKRLKDLARQAKQEEKRNRRLQKGETTEEISEADPPQPDPEA